MYITNSEGYAYDIDEHYFIEGVSAGAKRFTIHKNLKQFVDANHHNFDEDDLVWTARYTVVSEDKFELIVKDLVLTRPHAFNAVFRVKKVKK